ncbi:hypothetical protein SRHO_G00002550 [Serrasalmus rhombeus]
MPAGTFADLHQEALLLETEYGPNRYDTSCSVIRETSASHSRPQRADWRAELKQELLQEMRGQMRELTQEVIKELKPLWCEPSPNVPSTRATTSRNRDPTQPNQWDADVAGVQIPERGVVIVKDECSTYPMIIGMNVLSACWNDLFQEREQLRWKRTSPRNDRKLWQQTLATCQRIAAQEQLDGFVGHVWSASRRRICVPPESEMIVWGRVRANMRGQEHCGLVEPVLDGGALAVARTVARVKYGRIPVRLCNVHPYPMFIGKFQKLGKLYEVQQADVHGQYDLQLDASSEGVVEVSVIETVPVGKGTPTFEVSQFATRSDLTDQQQVELGHLLQKWTSVFAQNEEDFGCTDAIHHSIPTGGALPIRERFRPLPPKMYQEMRTLLADMLNSGVISESSSPWAAPVVMVRKKDGNWRFCVDYRKLNSVTLKDAFPMPRIEETLTTLTQAQWFSTLDLASGYWQVGVHPDDQPKTAFATPLGLFQFRRMPFGLCNAPATFQRLMQHCLRGQVAEFLFVYLDDIIVYSADFSLHLQHLEQVFERLSRYGLKLRPDKCNLLQKQVKFLGHVVDGCGVRPDPEKIAAVQEWAVPTTIKEVRAFLGLAGYYRRFIDGFAKLARPLNSLLVGMPVDRKTSHRQISWTPACQSAFEQLKQHLTEAPILAYANFSEPFIVYTDASNQGLGAVLSQMQDGRERVIAYASRSLHPSEKNDANYSSFKLELLALKWAVTEKFRGYLTGAKFTVMTDNNPVAHLQTAKLGATEQRWVAQLASFDFEVKYRAGRENGNADALSRFPCVKVPPSVGVMAAELQEASGETEMPVEAVDWQHAQEQDDGVRTLKWYVERGVFPTAAERKALPRVSQQLLHQRQKLQSKGGLLYRIVIDPFTNEPYSQIVCPVQWRKEVWLRYHEATGHSGVEKTLLRIRWHFYWPQMEEEVRGFQSGCVSCGLQKGNMELKAPLHPISVSFPLEVIALDFLSLSRPTDTYQNILVAVDMFTRYAWAIPTRDQTAKTTVKALWLHVIQAFGCPLRFHSDRGPNFESALFQQLCEAYGITRSRTTSYHPAGNGRVERMNQTLLHMSRTLEVQKQDRWPEFLPELLQAYNNTVHSATGFTPSYLMFGRVVRTPVDTGLGVGQGQPRKSLSGWVQDHHQKLTWAYSVAKRRMDEAASQSKQQFDRRAKATPLLPGQRVWVRDRNRQGRGKLCGWWSPTPYVIVESIGETGVVYKVRPEQGGPEKTLHRNALKQCLSKPSGPQQSQQEERETGADGGFIPYSVWTATPNVPDEVSANVPVRRSTRANFGQRPRGKRARVLGDSYFKSGLLQEGREIRGRRTKDLGGSKDWWHRCAAGVDSAAEAEAAGSVARTPAGFGAALAGSRGLVRVARECSGWQQIQEELLERVHAVTSAAAQRERWIEDRGSSYTPQACCCNFWVVVSITTRNCVSMSVVYILRNQECWTAIAFIN